MHVEPNANRKWDLLITGLGDKDKEWPLAGYDVTTCYAIYIYVRIVSSLARSSSMHSACIQPPACLPAFLI